MPAIRKPTNVLDLAGAFDKNPLRKRVDPKTYKPIGKPPKLGPITFQQSWKTIISSAPPGVLRDDRDRIWLEIASHLLVQFRADPAAMPPQKLARLTSCLSALGLSPADASRVVAEKRVPDGSDSWD